MKASKITEGDVIAALAKRFPAPAWAFLSHVRNGTGWSRSVRTADALAMSLWPSRGLELHGFEVKVSRNDWQKELKSPEKAEEIAQYCHRWWVVVADEAIVQDGELPPAWGLLALTKGGKLKTVVEAPLSEATPPDYVMLAAILRRATEGMVPQSAVDALVEKRSEEANEKERARFEAEVELRSGRLKELRAAVDEFEEASGVSIRRWEGGRIGAAVRIVLESSEHVVQQRRWRLERVAAEAEDIAERIRKAIAEQPAEETAA